MPTVDDSGNTNYIKTYDDATDTYLLGRPVFCKDLSYTLQARIIEVYRFRNYLGDEINNHDPDKVPSKNAIVEFTCNTESPNPVSVTADSLGVALHTFKVGTPDITSATSTISVTAKIGEGSTSFDWADNEILHNFIILGNRKRGTDFITKGPDHLLTVLRDPPGSKSYSFLEKGTTFNRETSYTGSGSIDAEENFVHKTAFDQVAFDLSGVAQEASQQTFDSGWTINEKTSHTGVDRWTTEFKTTIKTSDSPNWVGDMADVYVGYSTNISFGQCDKISIVPKLMYDEVMAKAGGFFQVYEDITPIGSPYLLVCHDAIEALENFSTLFAYTQHHIDEVEIPNEIRLRNSLLRANTEKTPEAFAANAYVKPEIDVIDIQVEGNILVNTRIAVDGQDEWA